VATGNAESGGIVSDHNLPVDSDVEVDDSAIGYSRPLHLQWRYVGIVAVGGTVGTAIREGLSLAVPATDKVAWMVLVINVLGAFLLGVLLELLSSRGPDEGRRRTMRLLIGTGALGGVTTYSSLAAATATLFAADRPTTAVAYSIATLVLGAAGTVAGIAAATTTHRRTRGGEPQP
jgi:CrcB protein